MNTRNLVYTALMTAIICVLGLVPGIPSNYASTYRITKYWYILAGIILGKKYGALSVIVFYY